MKTRAYHRLFVLACLAAGALSLAPAAAHAATTYVWDYSNIVGASSLDWFSGGPNTQATWVNPPGAPTVGGVNNTDTIQFFNDTTTAFNNAGVVTQTSNVNNGGNPVELGTLTIDGYSSATVANTYTLNISGDPLSFSGATGTINLNSNKNKAYSKFNVNSNIQLGTATSGSILTITGNGTANGANYSTPGFYINGNITEQQTGGGSLVKSGTSAVVINGALNITGGITVSAGNIDLNNANTGLAGAIALNGGQLRTNANNGLGTGDITLGGNANMGSSLSGTAVSIQNNVNVGTYNLTLAEASAMYNLDIAGVVSGTGTITTNTGSNTVSSLSNTGNTFTGRLVIGGGNTLSVGSLGDGSSIDLNSGILKFTSTAGAMTFNTRTINLPGNGTIDSSGTGAVVINQPVSPDVSGVSGTLTSSKAYVTVGSTANLVAGMKVVGANIPSGATIKSIDSATQFTLSTNATAGGASTLDFGYGSRTLTLQGSNTGNNIIAGNLQDSTATGTTGVLSLTKTGTGTWALSGTNTYTGATTVSQGTLLVDGSLSASSAVSVAAKSTLGGTGTLGGSVAVTGNLSPGDSIGTLTVGSASFLTTGNALNIELGSGSSSDRLAVLGTLDLSNANLVLSGAGSGSNYTIATYGLLNGGAFAKITGLPAGYSINYGSGTNSAITLSIPEPASLALLLAGGALILSDGRRRRRA